MRDECELNVVSFSGIPLIDDHDNADVFTTDFDDNGGDGQVMGPGSNLEVEVSFNPADAGETSAALTVTSDSPDEENVTVNLTGTGIVGPHFRFDAEGAEHQMLVQNAVLDGTALVEGDEIGVFTPGDICAGAVILEDVGDGIFPAPLLAYGGENRFQQGDVFAFKVWDSAADAEFEAVVEGEIEGDDVFLLCKLGKLVFYH